MAISGSLKDVKFIEILKIVGKRTGRLWIYNFDTNVYQEWFVHEHNIRAVRLNRVGQQQPDEIYRAAAALNRDTTSQYIFYAQEESRLPVETSLSIETVAVRLLTENLNFEDYRDLLPNPDTRFTAVPDKQAQLAGDLAKFWDNCRIELAPEFSAAEAAARFNLNLEQTQFNLYKLRAAGIIKPVRVVSYKPSRFNSAAISPPTNVSPPPKQAETPMKISPLPSSVVVNTERRGLVQRMLEALSLSKKD